MLEHINGVLAELLNTMIVIGLTVAVLFITGCASPGLVKRVDENTTRIETVMEVVQMQITQLAGELQALADQGAKVKAEVTEKIADMQGQIDTLKEQVEQGAAVPAEAVAVLDALKVKLQEIDDLVPDPAPEPNPTPDPVDPS